MKKRYLSLIIIAALFMVPLLSFEASARNAYGQACNNNDDCTSAICLVINPEIIPPEKTCGCRFDSECSAFPGTVCSTVHNKCIRSDAKAVGERCLSGSECTSTLCTAGVCACKINGDCGTGKTCTVSTGRCSSALIALQAAPRDLQIMPITGTDRNSGATANNFPCTTNADCASGYCANTGELGLLCQACRTNANCGAGKYCDRGICRTSSAGIASPIQSLIDEVNAIIAGIQARMVRLRL